jgi:hypothetical protein
VELSQKYNTVKPEFKANTLFSEPELAYQNITNLNSIAAPKYIDQTKVSQKELLNKQLDIRQRAIVN